MMHNWGDGTGNGGSNHMWGDGYGTGTWMASGGAGVMWLWWILAILAIGGAVYIAVRLANRSGKPEAAAPAAAQPTDAAPPAHTASSAREILEDRLARGEIDADEFRDRLKALTEA